MARWLPGARHAGAAGEGGQQGGKGDAVGGFGLQHLGGGGGDVQIFLGGGVFQGRQFGGLEIGPPAGFRPDRRFLDHRGGEGDWNIARPVERLGIGGRATGRSQGKHTDGQMADNRFHRALIHNWGRAFYRSALILPEGLQQIGLEPPFRQECLAVNLCRAPPVSETFIAGIKRKNRLCGRTEAHGRG